MQRKRESPELPTGRIEEVLAAWAVVLTSVMALVVVSAIPARDRETTAPTLVNRTVSCPAHSAPPDQYENEADRVATLAGTEDDPPERHAMSDWREPWIAHHHNQRPQDGAQHALLRRC
jgi:hypothetical protein